MQFTSFLLLITVSLLTLTAAWTKEDHEIFRVRDELTALEGADVSFYDFLGVVPTATYEEIKKQTKKRSRVLHPDRAVNSMLAERQKSAKKEMNKKAGVTVTKGPTAKERTKVTKEANDRYALLAVVVEILRGSSRDRYDHFLRNGFPVWKGTGYFYQRFRPGLGSVLVGLFIMFGGAAHYGAMIIGYRRQREFVERYVSHARSAAWGSENGIPGVPGSTGTATPPQLPVQDEDEMGAMPMNRRQKRMQEKEGKRKDSPRLARSARMNGTSSPIVAEQTSGPQGSKKKVVAPNGKVLIVDSVGNVYLEETTEEGETREFLLDVSVPIFSPTRCLAVTLT